MIIDCIADTHGNFPQLEGGDLLIVAGDLTARGTESEYFQCFDWLYEQDYSKKILIAGNHDTQMQDENYSGPCGVMFGAFDYLCDSGIQWCGLRIWGSPWTKRFAGENPRCLAFTCETEEELGKKWACIPQNTDILITHSPPWGILDKTIYNEYVGSKSLANKVGHMEKPPKLWIWGHVHEAYGIDLPVRQKKCKMVNASHVNERYEPVNKPVRIEL